MTKNFAVVTFPSDGNTKEEIVSEVPSLWLCSNLTKCWWPLVKNINTYIAKQTPPVTNDPKWSIHPIKFHGYYGNLYFTSKLYIIAILNISLKIIYNL